MTYTRLIILVCGGHALMAFELDLCDSGEVAYACGVWFTGTLGPLCLLLGAGLGLAYSAVRVAALNVRLVLFVGGLLCLGQGVLGVCIGSDLAFSTLSS
jgi:hypothetical protein